MDYDEKARELLATGPWKARCRSCGSGSGKACYGNGDMPRHLSHPERVKDSQALAIADAIQEAVEDERNTCLGILQDHFFGSLREVEDRKARSAIRHCYDLIRARQHTPPPIASPAGNKKAI